MYSQIPIANSQYERLEQLNAYQYQEGSLHEIFIYKMSFFLAFCDSVHQEHTSS